MGSSTIASPARALEATRAGEGAQVDTGSGPSEHRFALGVCALFLLVTIPVSLRHELWRDEWQAWLLARDVPSLGALLRLIHYEGHPALWYLLLRPIAHHGGSVWIMQLMTLASGVGAVYLFARFAPFPRALRALFAFGYFVVYGYTIVARSYAVGLVLVIVLSVVLTRSRARPLVAGIVMALLANVSVYGTILVIALIGAMVGAAAIDRAFRAESRVSRTGAWRRQLLMVVPALAGVVIAAAQMQPPPDAAFHGSGLLVRGSARAFDRDRLLPVWRGLVPIPNVTRPAELGGSDALASRSPRAAALAIVLSACMIVVAALLVRRSRRALLFYLLATFGLLAFSLAIYPGALYHHGHFYLALVMALWLARDDDSRASTLAPAPPGESPGHAASWLDARADALIGVLMTLQVIGGVARLVGDYIYPYTGAREAVVFLRTHGLANARVTAFPDFEATPISGYLGRAVIGVRTGEPATYMRWSTYRPPLDDTEVLARLERCCVRSDSGAVLILDHPLAVSSSALRVTPLARFDGTMINENFYLYDVHLAAPTPSAGERAGMTGHD